MTKKNKAIWKIIKKRLTPWRLIILIVLLVSNSFAWFIYATQVNSSVSVHVKGWKVEFKAEDTPIDELVNIDISNAYPGMSDFSQTITAYNESEVTAKISYTIMSVNLMGTAIKTVEGVNNEGGTLTGSEPTSAELAEKLKTDYPFTISITTSSSTIEYGTGVATFDLVMHWAFESGNDIADTEWGSKAYTYKESNPTFPSIAMVIRISVAQENG